MPPPLPRRSVWASCFAHSPSRTSLPRKGCRVGLRIVLFEACSAFTRVAACTLALSPIRDTLIEGFSHFVTSMTAPIASGWSGRRVGLAPTGKRRLSTAHTHNGHQASPTVQFHPLRCPEERGAHVRRRDFFTLAGSAGILLPLGPSWAQAPGAGKPYRLGFLGASLVETSTIANYRAFQARLRELGYNEGQNLVVERGLIDDPRGTFAVAAELMCSQPDLIVATGPNVVCNRLLGRAALSRSS